MKKLIVNTGIVVIAIILVTGIILLIIGASPKTDGNSGIQPAASPVEHVVKVTQPQTGSQIAAQLNCTRYKDHGPDQAGMSVDSGSCYIHGKKFALNTFPSRTVRNAWLKLARPLGVVPAWESKTAVVYPSVKD